jgi:hypothetical protein
VVRVCPKSFGSYLKFHSLGNSKKLMYPLKTIEVQKNHFKADTPLPPLKRGISKGPLLRGEFPRVYSPLERG